MAHELSFENGQYSFARVKGSERPWHGLGQEVDPNASTQTWAEQAGLNWEALRSQVTFHSDVTSQREAFNDKHVLYRSDTGNPLSVVSADYQIVQPAQILDFFGELTKGFQIETVGSLREGRKIWALAKIGEDAKILDDVIAPYLLLATSYDGSMATLAKFTTVRVVCRNTLGRAIRNERGQHQLTIPHSARFDAKQVRRDLGIAKDSWEEFQLKATRMATTKVTPTVVDEYLKDLLSPYAENPETIKQSKGYRSILNLFHGSQIGTGQDAIDNTVWGLLHATTQYIDHEKGRSQDVRMDAAWFGAGATLKERAFELADTLV